LLGLWTLNGTVILVALLESALWRLLEQRFVNFKVNSAADPERALIELRKGIERLKLFSEPAYVAALAKYGAASVRIKETAADTKTAAEAGLEHARPILANARDSTKVAVGTVLEKTQCAASSIVENVREPPQTYRHRRGLRNRRAYCRRRGRHRRRLHDCRRGSRFFGSVGSERGLRRRDLWGILALQSVGATGALLLAGAAAASTTGAAVGVGLGAAVNTVSLATTA